MSIWRRFYDWLQSLFVDAPVTVELEPGLGAAIERILDQPDWYAWECAQSREGGYCFWFDPYRYEGQSIAYPWPTPKQRGENFEADRQFVIDRYGLERMNRMIAWADKNYDGKFDPDSSYARSPIPVGLAMAEYLKSTGGLN